MFTTGEKGSLMRKQSKLHVEVNADGHDKLKVYATGCPISGHVVLIPPKDVLTSDFEISLLGRSCTKAHALQHSFQPTQHTFLHLKAIVSEASFPESGLLKAGQRYSVPFRFAIPRELSSSACKNACKTEVKTKHLQPPPSLHFRAVDDQSCPMSTVSYFIRAAITTKHGRLEKILDLRVLPAYTMATPFKVGTTHPAYRMEARKTVRQKLVVGKMGALNVATQQPPPILLDPTTMQASESLLTIMLDFLPDVQRPALPEIQVRSMHIESRTYFSLSHISHLPDREQKAEGQPTVVTPYVKLKELHFHQPGGTEWTRRKDSGFNDGPEPASKEGNPAGSTVHGATMIIPFALPSGKSDFFPPTFHACYVSRSYTLRVDLKVGSSPATLQLRLPLQINVEGFDSVRLFYALKRYERTYGLSQYERFANSNSLVMGQVLRERCPRHTN